VTGNLLIAAALAAVVIGAVVLRVRANPTTGKPCPRCGGTGKQLRLGARILRIKP
jgi:hypothetical protein